MTARPIIMTPENVRLLIREAEHPGSGKRETRRLLYIAGAEAREPTLLDGYPPHMDAPPKGANWRPSGWHKTEPRDRLWVREACESNGELWQRIADGSWCLSRNAKGQQGRRASFHMPRIDSRLTLIVDRVRIERVQDIGDDGALAEGIYFTPDGSCSGAEGQSASFPWEAYALLWKSLHPPPNSWADNPWVVVISFKPILGNIDSPPAAA